MSAVKAIEFTQVQITAGRNRAGDAALLLAILAGGNVHSATMITSDSRWPELLEVEVRAGKRRIRLVSE